MEKGLKLCSQLLMSTVLCSADEHFKKVWDDRVPAHQQMDASKG